MSLSAAEIEKYKELYDQYDANDDGLAFTEMVPLLRDMGWDEEKYPDSVLADKFLAHDTDNSRKFNKEEFIQLVNEKPRPEINELNIRRIFKSMDQDGSGKINAEEFREALKAGGCDATLDEINGMISAADSSGDGMIDVNELISSVCS